MNKKIVASLAATAGVGLTLALATAGGAITRGSVPRSPLDGKPFRPGVELVFDNGDYSDAQILYAHDGRVHQLSDFDYPAWAPFPSHDGKLIEFGGAPGGVSIMNRDGTNAHLVPGTHNCYPGGWGPNDAWVALSCGFLGPGINVPLVIVNTDGTNRRALGKMPPGESPSVNPKTGIIAFSEPSGAVYGVNPHTGRRTVLLAAGGSPHAAAPVWTPDGRALLVVVQLAAGPAFEILGPNKSKHIVRKIGWNTDLGATYSSDGKQIVYGGSADVGHDLYLSDARGKSAHRLTTIGDVGDPQWLPPVQG